MGYGDGTNEDQPQTTLPDLLREFLRIMSKSKIGETETDSIMTVLNAFSKDQLVQAVNGLSREEQDKLAPLAKGLFARDDKGNIIPAAIGNTPDVDPKLKALQDVADIIGKGAKGNGGSFDVDTQSELYKRGKISRDEFTKRLKGAGAADQDINDVLTILDDDKGTYQDKLALDKGNTSDKLAERAFDLQHQVYSGTGEGSRFNTKPGVDTILAEYKQGIFDRDAAMSKLVNQEKFTTNDAWNMIELADKGEDSSGGGGGGGGRGNGSHTNTQTTRHTTHYVDVPSAAEFLDDFRNGFATHLKGMAGSMGPDVAMWAIDNMEFFLNDYLGTLGQMAQKGQNPWTLAGDWDKADSSTSSSVSTTSPNAPSAGGGTPGSGGGSGGSGGGGEGPTSVDTSVTTDSDTLLSRQRPTQVATLSPTAYLGSTWNGPQIRTLYEGQKGARAAQSRAGGGQVARRL